MMPPSSKRANPVQNSLKLWCLGLVVGASIEHHDLAMTSPIETPRMHDFQVGRIFRTVWKAREVRIVGKMTWRDNGAGYDKAYRVDVEYLDTGEFNPRVKVTDLTF